MIQISPSPSLALELLSSPALALSAQEYAGTLDCVLASHEVSHRPAGAVIRW